MTIITKVCGLISGGIGKDDKVCVLLHTHIPPLFGSQKPNQILANHNVITFGSTKVLKSLTPPQQNSKAGESKSNIFISGQREKSELWQKFFLTFFSLWRFFADTFSPFFFSNLADKYYDSLPLSSSLYGYKCGTGSG